MGEMSGTVALVTGGASGIGRASAIAFAARGARVVIADVDEAGGCETARHIQVQGGAATFVRTDVSRAADVEGVVQAAIRQYGRLDYAHNNAGILGELAPTADCTEENWDRVVSTNLKGVWLCMKHEIREMLRQGGGAIVNTSSIWGLVGTEMGAPAYVATKHGIAGLTRAAALEYIKAGVRINAVCPGAVRTPLLETAVQARPELGAIAVDSEPIRRLGKPEEIAAAVVWLCSEAASFVVGATLSVDGGMAAA
jgi:NAD(P)-dependent dehydrogenase (short-subunit alcohol dehydrogenase family)